MDEASSRQIVIAGVRRTAASRPATRPEAFAWPASPSPPAALISLFVARAEAADAAVCAASGYDVALQRVADIMGELAAPEALVSGDAWESPWNVGRLATSKGRDPDLRTRVIREKGGNIAAIAKTAGVGVTAAAYGIAETGTIVVCSGQAGGRVESLLPPVHIALLKASDIVAGLPDLLAAVDRDRRLAESSAVTLITGPSRTADIELTLTIGVHGPKRLFVVVVED